SLLAALRALGTFDEFGDPKKPIVWLWRVVAGWALVADRPLTPPDLGRVFRRADRRVRDRHPSGAAGRRHAVLHRPGQLGEPEPGRDPDVPRRRAPDPVRNQALNTRSRIGAA